MKNSSKEIFNEDYYERGLETGVSCYSNFRWIPELTIPLCATMIETLGIGKFETILDFGAAKGFIVKAFRLLHRQAFGVEISNYAISKTPGDTKEFIYHYEKDYEAFSNMWFDWVIAKDVLEHIPLDQIDDILRLFYKISSKVFVAVPLGENGKYVIPAYELDVTHIIREPLDWWVNLFKKHDFEILEATYHMPHIKKNWEKWGTGNGFFILKSNAHGK